MCPESWLPASKKQADLSASLQSLLDLPLERILVSHGEPVLSGARGALETAIGD